MNPQDRFKAQPALTGTRCAVTACAWRHERNAWTEGVMAAVDDHMVAEHPTTEWAKRVIARRAAEQIGD